MASVDRTAHTTRVVVRDGGTVAPRALHVFTESPTLTVEEARMRAATAAARAKKAGRTGVHVIEWKPLPAGSKATVTL